MMQPLRGCVNQKVDREVHGISQNAVQRDNELGRREEGRSPGDRRAGEKPEGTGQRPCVKR